MEFQKYFQSYEDYFWEWDNQIFSEESVFEAITIPNGQTIGYEKFVFEILEYLSDDSIPPFGTLLLAVAATNPENEHAIEMIHNLAISKEKTNSFPTSNSFRTGASIDFLKLLSSLPNEYKTGEKRMQLFQTIFHGCHNRISSERAKKLIDEYKNFRHLLAAAGSKIPFNESNFIKDFRTVALLKVKFPTLQSILNAMENVPHEDLNDKLSEEVLEEKKQFDDPDNFVEQLIADDKTFQVGSLIKRLWSGLNIPLHHNHPSEQPLGGISDLTNKGDFDKLVISEFAYDDDVFMSRIANNEALYIQREVPPEADKLQRILVIDSSLKNWGNPKILSFASAIAIARHPKTDIECKVFIAGESCKEISIENVSEVITALNELSGKLDCAAGLDLFFSEHKISEKNQEVFLFSSDESLKIPAMQKAMSHYFNDIKYVFAIGMQDISVFKNQNKGRKLLQHIIMPLDELWAKENNSRRTNNRRSVTIKNTEVQEIPLLYPVERNYQNVFHDGIDFYLFLNGSLFLFDTDGFDKAMPKIASNLPFSDGNFAIKTDNHGEKTLLYHFYDGAQKISLINLKTEELKNHQFPDKEFNDKMLKVFEYNQEFYFTNFFDFWRLDDAFKLQPVNDNDIKTFYDDYSEKRNAFIGKYKKNKNKYSVIKRLDQVIIEENDLKINDYYLLHLEFEKSKSYFRRGDDGIVLEEKVNLVLKNKGASALSIVKLIKTNTDKTLVESKEIVDQDLGVVLQNTPRKNAEKLKKMLEKNGAICYIESVFFESEDGSRITNQDGVLIFESSDKRVEKFYIPFILNMPTIMVAANEYAGNEYFVANDYGQDSITVEVFREKYIKPFILNIVHHGT